MTIAKILVPVTGTPRDSIALATAFSIAKPFSAHVVALFVRPNPWEALVYTATPFPSTVAQQLIDDAVAFARESANHARKTLQEEAGKAGAQVLPKPQRTSDCSCSFHETQGYFAHVVTQASLLADLVVFGPLSSPGGVDINQAFVDTLLRIDRPVVIAEEAPNRMIRDISIAWDGGTAAAQALIASIPFLSHAEKIGVFSVLDVTGRDHDIAAVSNFLSLHGLSCTEHRIPAEGKPVAQVMMEYVRQRNTDLLVMGGYGRGHLRESLFGGVTAETRWNPAVPTLMAH
jgi:nucleotide-binding universal stress UspA family protein